VEHICTPDFLAFEPNGIREAWKVRLMVEAGLWARSYNCAGIPAGAPFVMHASSFYTFRFLVFKSAEVRAAVGTFVPDNSSGISLSQSALA
jgi:hypothetical protein